MDVQLLNAADPVCDQFVRHQPEGKICHLWAWADMIARHVGHEPLYLVAREHGTVRGVLPLSYVRSHLFGDRAVSQGFNNYGGPLSMDDGTCRALFDRAVELVRERNGVTIEFRNIRPLPYDLRPHPGKLCMHRRLTADPEALWRSLDPKVRNQVRKAEKSGITAANGGLELLDEFYGVYTARMRQLGSPCYPRSLFQGILKSFPDRSRLFVVRLKTLTVGGGITTCFNGLSDILYAATRVEYNHLCPNTLLYWSVLKHYSLAGATTFDFGRCQLNGPAYHFKKQWDPDPVALHYQYWVAPGRKWLVHATDSPRYQRKIELWKRLPLWMTRLVGPVISRNLP